MHINYIHVCVCPCSLWHSDYLSAACVKANSQNGACTHCVCLTFFFECVKEPEPMKLELKFGWATIFRKLDAMLFSPSECRIEVLGPNLP